MDITDFITFFLSLFFLARGAMRGFVQSLTLPFSIIVTTVLSIIYFQLTKEIILSLVIGLIGPFLMDFALKLLLITFAKATNTEIKPNALSRLGGSLLTLAWGWVFIAFTLVLLAVLPPWGKIMTNVHENVLKSASFAMVKPWSESLFAGSKQNAAVEATPSSGEAKTLAEDPRFQQVLQDPEVQKAIDAHDMVKLMRNPKMMELTRQIMSDPETLKKVMAVYSTQAHPQPYWTNSEYNPADHSI